MSLRIKADIGIPNQNAKYKTAKQIEMEAKRYGMEFVTYPPNYNFDKATDRLITEARKEALLKKQD